MRRPCPGCPPLIGCHREHVTWEHRILSLPVRGQVIGAQENDARDLYMTARILGRLLSRSSALRTLGAESAPVGVDVVAIRAAIVLLRMYAMLCSMHSADDHSRLGRGSDQGLPIAKPVGELLLNSAFWLLRWRKPRGVGRRKILSKPPPGPETAASGGALLRNI